MFINWDLIQKQNWNLHLKVPHACNAKVLYYVYVCSDDKVVSNSYIWITYSHILMLMFLQLVGFMNCKRKKVIVSHLLIVKEKCYSGIILIHMRTCCIYQL